MSLIEAARPAPGRRAPHCVPGSIVAVTFLAALTARSLAVAGTLRQGTEWDLLRDDDGIQTYRRTLPDRGAAAIRAVAMVDAPIAKVATVIVDTSRRVEWFPGLAEARVVREIGSGGRLEYWRMRMPIGFAEREFHVRASVEYDVNRVRLHAVSVSDPAFPVPAHVLATIRECEYTLSPVSADRTMVELIVDADPGGHVPSVMVHVFQHRNVRRNLEGLRRQSARTDIGTAPEIAEVDHHADGLGRDP